MYGSSEEVIGEGLKTIKNQDKLFAATKVWIPWKTLRHPADGRPRKSYGA
jgi:aryl-alcohol dehydrogenase-like predicted oxidoreductase